MSIFASQTQSQPIPIPFDPPHTFVVRKLTGRELQGVQEDHRSEFVSGRGRMWSKQFRRMLEHGASDPEARALLADPLIGFDRYALAQAGLVSWTYPDKRITVRTEPEHAANDAVERRRHIDDLDDDAVELIATEVLRLTKPALFEDAEAGRKNG